MQQASLANNRSITGQKKIIIDINRNVKKNGIPTEDPLGFSLRNDFPNIVFSNQEKVRNGFHASQSPLAKNSFILVLHIMPML